MLASLPKLAGYLSVTLFVTLLSVVPGLILAALLAVWKDQGSRIVSGGYRIFISFIRSTPFIVQLFVVYFGVPQLLSGAGVDVSDLPPLLFVLVIFALHVAGYGAEILHVRRNTAMVFQLYNLFSNMTVLQNVMEGLVTVQKMAKKEAREKAIACLQQVGMAEYLNAYPIQLSGGQQQRVGIARALAMNPKVILFDEPTSALDPEIVGEVLSVIREIASKLKITMIIVTHEIAFAREVADQVVFMENGYIVERGSAQEVLVHPKEKRTRQFLSRFLAPQCLSCDEMDPKKEAALWLNTAS